MSDPTYPPLVKFTLLAMPGEVITVYVPCSWSERRTVGTLLENSARIVRIDGPDGEAQELWSQG